MVYSKYILITKPQNFNWPKLQLENVENKLSKLAKIGHKEVVKINKYGAKKCFSKPYV